MLDVIARDSHVGKATDDESSLEKILPLRKSAERAGVFRLEAKVIGQSSRSPYPGAAVGVQHILHSNDEDKAHSPLRIYSAMLSC